MTWKCYLVLKHPDMPVFCEPDKVTDPPQEHVTYSLQWEELRPGAMWFDQAGQLNVKLTSGAAWRLDPRDWTYTGHPPNVTVKQRWGLSKYIEDGILFTDPPS